MAVRFGRAAPGAGLPVRFSRQDPGTPEGDLVTVTSSQAQHGCPVINLNTSEGGKRPGEWVEIWDALRAQAPMLFNEFGPAGGFFMPTRYADVMEVMQDAARFSSQAVSVFDPEPAYRWIPEMLDPPEHRTWRQQLAPLFSPKQTERLDDRVRARAVELIEGLKDRGRCDFNADFASRFPTTIFLELMGLPVEDLDRFLRWEEDILHGDSGSPAGHEAMMRAMGEVMGMFSQVIEQRRVEPADDIITKALAFDIGGRPPTDDELLSFCLLMFMAGLDTVTQNLNYSIYHLATHEADRRRIAADPQLLGAAIEEFIRAYSIVVPARKATCDTKIAGVEIKAGQMVAVSMSTANRDEAAFPDGTSVIIDRSPNSHIGFGAGQHRCLGSHLARREMRIALEEWHARIPDYRLAEGAAPREHGGMYGLDSLLLEWDV
jgi:cytochrome P450